MLEEPSAKAFLQGVIPKILSESVQVEYRVFRGKDDLLRKLPNRLKGYSYYPEPPKILVLVDRDDSDCTVLKAHLEKMCADVGFSTRSSAAPGEPYLVCNRIAVEELESWILGDEPAMRKAFPRLRPFATKANYRDPDSIRDTWEAMERLLQRAGYYSAGLQKVHCATEVSKHIDPDRNRSQSFHTFVAGLTSLVGT